MKKILVSLLVVVVFFLAVITITGKKIVAAAVESAIGAPVKIGKIKLNPFSGQVGLYGLEIGNTPGFKEPNIAIIPEIFIHADPLSFLGKPHIREIRLNIYEVTVERDTAGVVNLSKLGAMQRPASAKTQIPEPAPAPSGQQTPPAGRPSETRPPVTVQIDKVDLTLGRARFIDYSQPQIEDRQVSLNIKHAVFTNLTDPAQIVQQIVFQIMEKVALQKVTAEFEDLVSGFQKDNDSTRQALENQLAGLASKLEKQLEKSNPQQN